MDEKRKTNNANDFARYHAGEMTAAEMHALEKAALADPFLADALEGYAHTDSPESDAVEIKNRLTERSAQQQKGRIIPFSIWKWWNVAAIAIMVVGIGFFVFRSSQPVTPDLAVRKAATQESKSEIPALNPHTLNTENDVAMQPPASARKQKFPESALLHDKKSKKGEAEVSRQPLEVENHNSPVPETAEEAMKNMAMAAPANASVNRQEKKYSFRGRVLDENGNGIPYALLRIDKENKMILADKNGHFVITADDTTGNLTTAAVGYQAKSVPVHARDDFSVQLATDDSSLEEVVVTSYSNKISQRSSAPAVKGKTAEVELSKHRVQPFPVNTEFDEYVQENAVPIFTMTDEELSGEVTLSFSVNKDGKPENINVLRSTCQGCESQAVLLLKNGPAWKKQKNRKGTVNIAFPTR